MGREPIICDADMVLEFDVHVTGHRDKFLIIKPTYLLTPWSRVLLEKLTSKLCS